MTLKKTHTYHTQSLFIGADADGHDLGDHYGMLLFAEQVIKEVGKFAGNVYHKLNIWGKRKKAHC